MGSASTGPLVVKAEGQPGPLCFVTALIDPLTLNGAVVTWKNWRQGQAWGPEHVRVSADGRAIIGWGGGWAGMEMATVSGVRVENVRPGAGFLGRRALLAADASQIFTDNGLVAPTLNAMPADELRGAYLFPSADPRFYLSIAGQGGGAELRVHGADQKVIFRSTESDLVKGGLPPEKRVHLVPVFDVLLAIPQSRDRLVIRRFNLEEILDKAGALHLFVASTPVTTARRGADYAYQMVVKSKKGDLKYRLEAGPEGMTVSREGLVTWKVPADYDQNESNIIILMADSGGQESHHTFKLAITGDLVIRDNPNPGKPPDPRSDPGPIKPVRQERIERQLPGVIADVCVGGGGRYLILHLPTHRQLAIFDIGESKVVKFLPVAEDGVKFAAGRDKLLVALPTANVLQRWNLTTFEREVTTPIPERGTVTTMCMGSASSGPLYVGLRDGPAFFLDPVTMKKIDVKPDKGALPRDGVYVRASADGKVFGMRNGVGGEPHTVTALVLQGEKSVAMHQEWNFAGSVITPGPDGRFVYSAAAVLSLVQCRF